MSRQERIQDPQIPKPLIIFSGLALVGVLLSAYEHIITRPDETANHVIGMERAKIKQLAGETGYSPRIVIKRNGLNKFVDYLVAPSRLPREGSYEDWAVLVDAVLARIEDEKRDCPVLVKADRKVSYGTVFRTECDPTFPRD